MEDVRWKMEDGRIGYRLPGILVYQDFLVISRCWGPSGALQLVWLATVGTQEIHPLELCSLATEGSAGELTIKIFVLFRIFVHFRDQ